MILFCIPYAGGSSAFFVNIKRELELCCKVVLYDYPGHGTRMGEELLTSMDEIVSDASSAFDKAVCNDEEIILLGYSMGSIVAYEVAKRASGHKLKHLFIAAMEPPHILSNKEWKCDFDNAEEFYKLILHYGSFGFEQIRDPRFRDIFLKLIKNDFRCIFNYNSENMNAVSCDLTVMNSSEDIDAETAEQWCRYTNGKFDMHNFCGNHFFLTDNVRKFAEIICKKIAN